MSVWIVLCFELHDGIGMMYMKEVRAISSEYHSL